MPMKTENIAPIFKSNLDTKSEQYLQNKKGLVQNVFDLSLIHYPLRRQRQMCIRDRYNLMLAMEQIIITWEVDVFLE